jgi:hypothetical protein
MSNITISQKTMMVLKNFATINGSILIRKGNILKTISIGENAVAQYSCAETFPQTFGIYDLNQFLSGLTLFPDPVLRFDNEHYVTISGGGRSAKYYFSSPEITLKAAPEKDVAEFSSDMSFMISQEDILALQKASAVYGINDLKFESIEDVIRLSLVDKEDETSNVFSIDLPGDSTGTYEFFMKMENIRLLPGNYDVRISKHLITEWKHNALDLKYYIALEP